MRMSQARIATVIILMFTCLLTHTAFGQRQKPDYIGGPWLYAAVPCDGVLCEDVRALETDFLARFTGRLVAENEIAQAEAKPKDILFLGGRLTWQTGFLGGKGLLFTDNVGNLVESADLNPAGYSNAVFYGLIVLDADKPSSVMMHLGYSAFAKIWINGEVVYKSENRNWLNAEEMQANFLVSLQRGKNLLMAKVIEGIGWNLFVGFNANFRVSYRIKNGQIVPDDSLPVEPLASTVSTRWASLKMGSRLIKRVRD